MEQKLIFKNKNGREINWDLNTAEKMLGIDKVEIEKELLNGNLIKVPFGTLKLANMKTCPLCTNELKQDLISISRRDNKTEICSECGTEEALEELKFSKKKKIKIFEVHFAWVSEGLLQAFTRITGIKRKPDWIKSCVFDDFGLELNSKEDIPKLDFLLRKGLYEDKAEWLKEKMRTEIKRHLKK